MSEIELLQKLSDKADAHHNEAMFYEKTGQVLEALRYHNRAVGITDAIEILMLEFTGATSLDDLESKLKGQSK